MAADRVTTAFVTEASSLLGLALVAVLRTRGLRVLGLAATPDAAELVRWAGATPVSGSLMQPGRWQDEVAADWVFHLPSHPFEGRRVSRADAAAIASARVRIDASVLDAAGAGATRRIVYVGDSGYYGATGAISITESAPPRPAAWGRCLAPAMERLEGYVLAGFPIVTALPGWVYGNGSWFQSLVIAPILEGRAVWQWGPSRPWVSVIHVTDCARALVHLALRGRIGDRYFLVNDAPVRLPDVAAVFARLTRRRLRVRRMPAMLARLAMGPIAYEHITSDAVFSPSRLHGLGFQWMYPTVEDGVAALLGALHE